MFGKAQWLARNLWFPLPYATHCKITWDGNPQGMFYYNGLYLTFAPDTRVETFTMEMLKTNAADIKAAGQRLISRLSSKGTITKANVTDSRGSSKRDFHEIRRPRRRATVRVSVQAEDYQQASDLRSWRSVVTGNRVSGVRSVISSAPAMTFMPTPLVHPGGSTSRLDGLSVDDALCQVHGGAAAECGEPSGHGAGGGGLRQLDLGRTIHAFPQHVAAGHEVQRAAGRLQLRHDSRTGSGCRRQPGCVRRPIAGQDGLVGRRRRKDLRGWRNIPLAFRHRHRRLLRVLLVSAKLL